MKLKTTLLLAVGAAIASQAVAATTLPTWKISTAAGTGSIVYSWFANDSLTRGMCYNPATGNLLIAARTGGNIVHIVNSATGADIGSVAGTFSVGGGAVLNKVVATNDGIIFAGNLDTAGSFKIYKAANEAATFAAVYEQATANPGDTLREGDDLAIRRTGPTNLELLVPGGTNTVRLYSSTNNGDSWTMSSNVISGITVASSPSVVWDTDNTLNRFYWRSSSNGNVYAISSATWTLVQTYAEGSAARIPMAIRVDANDPTKRMLGFGIGASTAGSNPPVFTKLIDTASSTISAQIDTVSNISQGALVSGTNIANTNASGDVEYVGNVIYTLFTNNAITRSEQVSVPVNLSGFTIE